MSLFRKSFMETGPKRPNEEQKQIGGQRPVKRRSTERFFNIVREPNGDLYSVVLAPEIFLSQKIDMVIKSQENKMEDEIPDNTPILVNQLEYFNEGNPNRFAIIDFYTAYVLDDCVFWVFESSNDPNNPNDAITEIYNNRTELYTTTKKVLGRVAKFSRKILMVPRTLFNKLDASSREKLAEMFRKIYVITFLAIVEVHNPYLDNIIQQ